MRARYVIHITPADVGQRVSIRSWLADAAERDEGPYHTDALGTLESWDDGWLSIRRRDGSLVTVDEALMVAGKLLPPPPATRPRFRG
ncbi:hypothetical protein BH23ACT9_BH23ACT9_00780 [soil metagenome]